MAGASARLERQRRTAKREQAVHARHRHLGKVILALTDDPVSTKVWDRGALGEEKVGAALDRAADRGVLTLHDRAIPRSRANIDHLVVAPSGIWVVDSKRYSGKLERRDVGGLFRTDLRLYVAGRDRTKLVDGVIKQVELVQRALAGGPFAAAPVRGALCFIDTTHGWFAKPFTLREVQVTWPNPFVASLVDPAAAILDEASRSTCLAELASRFRPAT